MTLTYTYFSMAMEGKRSGGGGGGGGVEREDETFGSSKRTEFNSVRLPYLIPNFHNQHTVLENTHQHHAYMHTRYPQTHRSIASRRPASTRERRARYRVIRRDEPGSGTGVRDGGVRTAPRRGRGHGKVRNGNHGHAYTRMRVAQHEVTTPL